MINLLKDVYDFKFHFNHLLIEKIGKKNKRLIKQKGKKKVKEVKKKLKEYEDKIGVVGRYIFEGS